MGFARSDLTVEAIRTACIPYLKVKPDRITRDGTFFPTPFLSRWMCNCCHYSTQVTDTEAERLQAFFSRNTYISGKYADESSFSKLNAHILSLPGGSEANRLFYLALPPTVYHDVTKNIRHCCMSTKSVQTHLLLTAAVSQCLLHELL